MKIRHHLTLISRRFLIPGGLAAVVFAVGLIANQALAETSQPAVEADQRAISIYDRGAERVIVTKARTVRQALELAKIDIQEDQDVVEPALDTELVTSKYNINIYRARPVVIDDGIMRRQITTAEQTATNIARVANMTLYPEDRVDIGASGTLLVDGANIVLKVDRATPIHLTLYGKKTEVRTQAATVGEFLQEKQISLQANDTLSVAESTPITNGMSIELWRNGVQTVTVDEEIAFTTEKVKDANRETGYHEVKEKGENGAKTVTYEIEMRNGVEVARKEIASVTTKEPKKQVEIVGTKVNLPAGSHTDWMAAAGIAESDFGYANYLVTKESGWRVNATNASSGAYGLPQALPGSKMASAGSDWQTNPITQLKWMNGYVIGRYGSWANAVAHSQTKGWY